MTKQASFAGSEDFVSQDVADVYERLRAEIRSAARTVFLTVTVFMAAYNWTLYMVLKDA